MLLAFDHFYTTTFEQGSNQGNSGIKLIDTYIKDEEEILNTILKGRDYKLYVEEWLAKITDDLNFGTLDHRIILWCHIQIYLIID